MSSTFINNSIAAVEQQLKDCFEIDLTVGNWQEQQYTYPDQTQINVALRNKTFNYYTVNVDHDQATTSPIVTVYRTGGTTTNVYVGVEVLSDSRVRLTTATPIAAHVMITGGYQNIP